MAFVIFHHLIEEILNEDEVQRRNHLRIRNRNIRDTSNPFELPEKFFIKLFRLSKECTRDLIDSLMPHMGQRNRINAVPAFKRILTTLHFYGHGSYQLGVGHGHTFALSQPMVSRCITEVTRAINAHLLHQWIQFPTSVEAKQEIALRFQQKHGFPNTIGVIDCSQIEIIAPPFNHAMHPAAAFYCRKGFYSINTQIICDSEYTILNVNARFPGSVHDAAIWQSSAIKEYLERDFVNGNMRYYLSGDGGYPIEPWLLILVLDAQDNTPEARYNSALSSTRIIIEHVNGILKSRFRCLLGHRVLNYDHIKTSMIINSCCVLHNMTVSYNVEMPEDVIINPVIPENNAAQAFMNNNNNNWLQQGIQARQEFILNNFIN